MAQQALFQALMKLMDIQNEMKGAFSRSNLTALDRQVKQQKQLDQDFREVAKYIQLRESERGSRPGGPVHGPGSHSEQTRRLCQGKEEAIGRLYAEVRSLRERVEKLRKEL